MSRILIHSIVFKPDGVSTAYLYADLVSELKKYGHEIVVLTSTPHYNYVEEAVQLQPLKKKAWGLYYISVYDGMKVYHIPMRKSKSLLVRMFDFIRFHILSVCIGVSLKKFDIVLSPSPPLTIGIVSWFIAKIKGGKSIYNVQEIYPEFAINQGFIKNKIIISVLKKLEKLVYNLSKAVITIDKHFSDIIRPRMKDPSRLRVIPNFVDTGLYHPYERINDFSTKYQLNDSFVIGYAGNIGYAQNWAPILYAAKNIKHLPIKFLIVGDGVNKAWLSEEIKKDNLTNILLLSYQPRELMPMINASADIHTILMNPSLDKDGFPSKVYTIMACAKSLIISTGSSSPLAKLLRDTNVNRVINLSDNEGYKQAVVDAFNEKENLKEEGENCRKYIVTNYSKEVIGKKYNDLINLLAGHK